MEDSFESDVTVLSPTVQGTSGGVKVTIDLYEELWRSGLSSRVIAMDSQVTVTSSWKALSPSQAEDLPETKLIVSTDLSTHSLATELSRIQRKPIVNFLQGPEMFFSNGVRSKEVINHLREVDLVLCVSPFLAGIAETVGAIEIKTIPMGPEIEVFYPPSRDSARKSKVVLSSRPNPDKGAYLLPLIAEKFSQMGYEVVSMGPTHQSLIGNSAVENLGNLPPQEVRRQLEEAEFVFDPSNFEGLGLVPLEALALGCKPIITPKGGFESLGIPEDLYHTVTISTLLTQDFGSNLEPLTQDQSERAFLFFSDLNRSNGLEKAVLHIRELLGL
jgi:hypothetical protein